MKNLIATLFLFMTVIPSVTAQEKRDWESYLLDYGEMTDIEASTWESSFDILYYLEDNPMNINTATREDLEQLPFLTARNVEEIQEYIYLHGPMKTLGELALLKSIDYNQRQLLYVFTYAGDIKKALFPKLSNILKYGKHDFIASAKIPSYKRKGDYNGYEGYQFKHSIKYDFTYGDYVRLGFLGSQDAGEPFFATVNSTGYDFYSFYLVLKKLGRIKTFALGRYRLKFGMGLVVNNNYNFGKLSALTTMLAQGSNIRAHASRSDANYMQGAATTISLTKNIDVSLFASYRQFDATLNKDGTISTILSSGYHRTRTEIGKKNNSSNTTAGGNINFRRNGFHIGATAVYTTLNRELKPNTSTTYRYYYASGRNFFNAGIDYGYNGHKFTFSGETATGSCGAIATINLLTYSISDQMTLTALQRYYSYKYYTLLGRSFSEGGMVQNETGAYFGINWKPTPELSVLAYSDCAYFEWPKYQAFGSSYSFDNLVQATWTPRDSWSFTARYRLKLRQKDNAEKTALIYQKSHRARLSATYNGKAWQSKTQADLAFYNYKKRSFGWMFSQNLCCMAINKLLLNASATYFNTDDYDSRIYTYERGLLYSFSVPSFYGHGVRYTMLASTEVIRNLLLTAKIGTSNYFDRNTIGSGYQRINGSSATDLELQARWKF